jgi:hypothetical protein
VGVCDWRKNHEPNPPPEAPFSSVLGEDDRRTHNLTVASWEAVNKKPGYFPVVCHANRLTARECWLKTASGGGPRTEEDASNKPAASQTTTTPFDPAAATADVSTELLSLPVDSSPPRNGKLHATSVTLTLDIF